MKETSKKQIRALSCFSTEKEFLTSIEKKAEKEKIPITGHSVCRFLELFCFAKNPEKILEIGCGLGYSSYFLIKNLKGSYLGIDLNTGRLKEAEHLLKGIFKDKDITFHSGNAIDVLKNIDLSFDLVFIDAAKAQYPDYLKALMGKVKKNSYIAADNILYKGLVFEGPLPGHHKNSVAGIREYLYLVSNTCNFNTRIFDIGDGISVSEVL